MWERANHSLLLSVSPNATVDTEAKLADNEGKHSLSRLEVLVKTSQTWPSILGFHMTSPKFKLRNYRFFWVSTFTWYYSTLKPLYKQFFGSKRFFVLQQWTLAFPSFAWCSISWQPGKLINLGKTFFRISHVWSIAQTWFVGGFFVYLSSFISQILDFLH